MHEPPQVPGTSRDVPAGRRDVFRAGHAHVVFATPDRYASSATDPDAAVRAVMQVRQRSEPVVTFHNDPDDAPHAGWEATQLAKAQSSPWFSDADLDRIRADYEVLALDQGAVTRLEDARGRLAQDLDDFPADDPHIIGVQQRIAAIDGALDAAHERVETARTGFKTTMAELVVAAGDARVALAGTASPEQLPDSVWSPLTPAEIAAVSRTPVPRPREQARSPHPVSSRPNASARPRCSPHQATASAADPYQRSGELRSSSSCIDRLWTTTQTAPAPPSSYASTRQTEDQQMHPPTTETRPPFKTVAALTARAAALTVHRWDHASDLAVDAAGLAFALDCEDPVPSPAIDVSGLTAAECLTAALAEVTSWDWSLLDTYPDITRLTIILSDAKRALQQPHLGDDAR